MAKCIRLNFGLDVGVSGPELTKGLLKVHHTSDAHY